MSFKEFEEFINANKNLSERTLKAYSLHYSKFDDMHRDILTQNQTNIINYIDEKSISMSAKLSMLNIAIVFRKFFEKDNRKLLKQKNLYDNEYREQKNKNKEDKLSVLPTTNDLIAYEKKLYREENWLGYIINYLMRKLSLRNKDLNLKIIAPTRKKISPDDKTNYLILRKRAVGIVRNDYKTAKKYGQKKNDVQGIRLVKAVHNLINEREQKLGDNDIFLLSPKKLNEDSIQKKIRSYTLNGISETDMNKIIVSELVDLKDIKKLKEISNNRGTSLSVLLNEYHLKLDE